MTDKKTDISDQPKPNQTFREFLKEIREPDPSEQRIGMSEKASIYAKSKIHQFSKMIKNIKNWRKTARTIILKNYLLSELFATYLDVQKAINSWFEGTKGKSYSERFSLFQNEVQIFKSRKR